MLVAFTSNLAYPVTDGRSSKREDRPSSIPRAAPQSGLLHNLAYAFKWIGSTNGRIRIL